MTKENFGLLTKMIDFETGTLGFEQTIKLFSCLVKNGMAWTLQGFYGRTATRLIDNGYIDIQGNINEELLNMYIPQEF